MHGAAPQRAPDAMAVPLYAGVGAARETPIGTYVGVPIRGADDTLYVSRYPQEGRLFSLALLYTLQPAANR